MGGETCSIEVFADYLEQILDAIKGAEGTESVLICDRDARPKAMKLYKQIGENLVLPESLREKS